MADNLANIFANSPLDRATHRRSQAAWLEQAQKDGFILPLWRGQIFAPTPKEIGFVRAGFIEPIKQIGQIFLGVDKKQKSYFACALDDHKQPEQLLAMGEFLDLRALAAEVSADDIAIAAQARALTEWHKNHIFCARCGNASSPLEGGHKRFCAACELEHFPRTDPVVIMMITLGDKAFLGRQKSWPQGFYSALAGFVEPGETIEEAVKRESFEEAKLDIVKIGYHSTQPWPYPYSLMIGCFAEAAAEDFEVDGVELEAGKWFERSELQAILENSPSLNNSDTPNHRGVLLPPPLAIAHRLIHAFVYDDN